MIQFRQGLDDTDGFLQDLVLDAGFERTWCAQVHPASQQRFQTLLEFDELEEPNGLAEFHQQVHIAVGAGLIARNRPEHGQRFYMVLLNELVPLRAQKMQRIVFPRRVVRLFQGSLLLDGIARQVVKPAGLWLINRRYSADKPPIFRR
jgi:hypothetical protein